MGFKLPRRKHFTPAQLAVELKTTEETIDHYADSGRLQIYFKVGEEFVPGEICRETGDCWVLDNDLRHEPFTGPYFPLSEVERFEADNQGEQISDTGEALYLMPTHKYHSKELAAAVHVWQVLFGAGGKYKSNQAITPQIKKELAAWWHPDKPSKSAMERMMTLINPRKEGGSPTTGRD